MKFKHNDKVTCKIYGEKITDARISIDAYGTPFICQNVRDGAETDDRLGYKYSWVLNKDFTRYGVTNLRLAEKTFDNLEIGDELVNGDGIRTVLGICGRVIFTSSRTNKDVYDLCYTKEEFIKYGYTIVQPKEETEELTMDEVCKALGRVIKIKK